MRAWHRRCGALLGAVALLTLAGCANAKPGVAAYVGDTRITQKEVDRAVAGVAATLAAEGQQVSRDAVVNAMIHGELAEQIAADRNISVTDSEREALIRASNLAPLLAVPDARSIAFDVADQRIVGEKIGAEAYLTEVRERPVTLNPRFGVLEPTQKLIRDDQTGSLARPVPAPAPSR